MAFTVASYNVLATAYIRKRFYPRTPDEVLAPSWRVPALVRHIARLDADIVCLQEVEDAVFAALQAGLPAHRGHFLRKAGDRPDGCATLVRASAGPGTVEPLRYADGRGAEQASGHVALLNRLHRSGRLLGVANTHLKWSPPGGARDDHWGVRQVEQLVAALGGAVPACDAWIICGDLNVEPDSEVMATLRRAGFRSAYGDRAAYTCNPNGTAKVIDYLCHGDALRSLPHELPAIDGRTALPSPEQPSDHLAIMASFEWAG